MHSVFRKATLCPSWTVVSRPVTWQQAQDGGWTLLAAHYDQRPFAQRLLARIAECRANLAEHRRDNFTGAMLRHHQHKSTQYMAQWIEAKNRLASL